MPPAEVLENLLGVGLIHAADQALVAAPELLPLAYPLDHLVAQGLPYRRFAQDLSEVLRAVGQLILGLLGSVEALQVHVVVYVVDLELAQVAEFARTAIRALGVRNQRPADLAGILRVRVPVAAKDQFLAVGTVLRTGLQEGVVGVAVEFFEVGPGAHAARDRVPLAVLCGTAELGLIGMQQELALVALCERAEVAVAVLTHVLD